MQHRFSCSSFWSRRRTGVFQRARLFLGWLVGFRCVLVSVSVGCEGVYVTHCLPAVAAERAV
jgi:hypothetical protein